MTTDTETSDRLLTEVERQQKYLDKLPNDFAFPLFNAAQALESQRRSGYRNTASAAREIIDNAIEAGATRIDVCFERPLTKAKQTAEAISSIAFIDNGSGMLPKMAQYALSWGAGTHFDDPSFIGKFGFGLPNASINQTRLVEVYTKVRDAKNVTKARLDVREVKAHGLQTILPPVDADLPEFVQKYLDKNGLPFEHGTVVVWVNPDRITYRKAAVMREHLVDDFGVTYRRLLDKVDLHVEGAKIEPIDPLFLSPEARFFLAKDAGGAEQTREWNIAVKYERDPDTGVAELKKVEDISELDPNNEDILASGAIYVRVSRFPYGFAEFAGKGQKAETDAHKRFEVRKARRGMSFVRAGREIETVDVFPKSTKEIAKGLGEWPLLQSYAYHWGVEVRFEPRLDEVFGITNDKQTVRPVESLWRLLSDEEVDEQLSREQAWQHRTRRAENQKRKAAKAARSATPTLAETAAAGADSIGGQRPTVPDHRKGEARAAFEEEAGKRAGVDKSSIDEARKALEAEARKRPYVIDFFEDANGPFYKPNWDSGVQVAILINKKHPFFEVLYGPLQDLPNGGETQQALDVLLIALARAELKVNDEQASLWYETQRERAWSPFLSDALKLLRQKMEPTDEEAAEALNRGEDLQAAE